MASIRITQDIGSQDVAQYPELVITISATTVSVHFHGEEATDDNTRILKQTNDSDSREYVRDVSTELNKLCARHEDLLMKVTRLSIVEKPDDASTEKTHMKTLQLDGLHWKPHLKAFPAVESLAVSMAYLNAKAVFGSLNSSSQIPREDQCLPKVTKMICSNDGWKESESLWFDNGREHVVDLSFVKQASQRLQRQNTRVLWPTKAETEGTDPAQRT